MKYEKTNEGFIKKFIDKKTNYVDRMNSLIVEGDKLYSYSMLIADRKKKSIYHTKYSMTTSQHIGKVKSLSDYMVSVSSFDYLLMSSHHFHQDKI